MPIIPLQTFPCQQLYILFREKSCTDSDSVFFYTFHTEIGAVLYKKVLTYKILFTRLFL